MRESAVAGMCPGRECGCRRGEARGFGSERGGPPSAKAGRAECDPTRVRSDEQDRGADLRAVVDLDDVLVEESNAAAG